MIEIDTRSQVKAGGHMEALENAGITKRNRAIDNFRGISIILMVIVNYLGGADAIPSWLKHSQDLGLTIADFVAPFFIFAIGLTFRSSFERRSKRYGLFEAYRHFAVRYLAIIGNGTIFSAGQADIAGQAANWGVQHCLCFLRCRNGTAQLRCG